MDATSNASTTLTREQMAAIIASDMLTRGADAMTWDKDKLERLQEEVSLTVRELDGCYILVADDAEVDTDATDAPTGDNFPTITK